MLPTVQLVGPVRAVLDAVLDLPVGDAEAVVAPPLVGRVALAAQVAGGRRKLRQGADLRGKCHFFVRHSAKRQSRNSNLDAAVCARHVPPAVPGRAEVLGVVPAEHPAPVDLVGAVVALRLAVARHLERHAHAAAAAPLGPAVDCRAEVGRQRGRGDGPVATTGGAIWIVYRRRRRGCGCLAVFEVRHAPVVVGAADVPLPIPGLAT